MEMELPSTLPHGTDGNSARCQPCINSSFSKARAPADPHCEPEELEASKRTCMVPEAVTPIFALAAELQSRPHGDSGAKSSVGENSSTEDKAQHSPHSPAPPDAGSAQASQAPTRHIATPAPKGGVGTMKCLASLLPMVRLGVLQKVLLGGGVVIVAWLAAMRRTRSIFQPVRLILRILSLYQEIMQRLH